MPEAGPFILAIETATDLGSVAVYEGPRLRAYLELRRARTHASRLAPMIQALLAEAEVSAAELSAIAVGQGPGSYTGLRVGVSTAKGLSYALDKPLLSFGSLEALAWQVLPLARQLDAWICPLIDARRMEVYCAFFDAAGQLQRPIRAEVIDEQSFATELAERRVLFVGDGVAKCAELLSRSPQAMVLPEVLASAKAVGPLLAQKFAQQAFEDLAAFEPFYLKDFVATKPKDKLRG